MNDYVYTNERVLKNELRGLSRNELIELYINLFDNYQRYEKMIDVLLGGDLE